MILAIIPARSGSKSIKDKNIKPLAGRPLMAWSIKAALACKQIDKVVVSTDSDKYAQLAEFYGAEVIMRPLELATDDTPMIPVLQHAVKVVEKQGNQVKLVLLFDPTSPLRQVKDIEACLELIKQPETDSVVTICDATYNPYYFIAQVKNGYLNYPLFKLKKSIHRRQDAPKAYRLNGAMYVIKRDILMSGKIFTDKTRAMKMPQERSSHIDNLLEFKYCEWLLKEGYVKLDY